MPNEDNAQKVKAPLGTYQNIEILNKLHRNKVILVLR